MNNKISNCQFVIQRIRLWDFPWSILLHLVSYLNVSLSLDEILIAGSLRLLVRGMSGTLDKNTYSVFLKVEIGQFLKFQIFMGRQLNNFNPVTRIVLSLNVFMLMVDLRMFGILSSLPLCGCAWLESPISWTKFSKDFHEYIMINLSILLWIDSSLKVFNLLQ